MVPLLVPPPPMVHEPSCSERAPELLKRTGVAPGTNWKSPMPSLVREPALLNVLTPLEPVTCTAALEFTVREAPARMLNVPPENAASPPVQSPFPLRSRQIG